MKTVLTIAGSDCSGGAGVQADLKTMAAHGVFGMSVIVSVVSENTARVIDIQDITPKMIEEQIDAVFEDIVPDAVKIGMLSSPECMKAVAGKLAQYKPAHIVIDPVMFAKNGDPLMDPASVGTLIETVLPFAEVLTPNVPEAQYLADMEIRPRTWRRQHAASMPRAAGTCSSRAARTSQVRWMYCLTARPVTALRLSRSTPPARTARAARCPLRSHPIWRSATVYPRR